jgi:hypothetical protein
VSGYKTVIAHREDPARYEIRIRGHLDPRRLEPFEETTIAHLAGSETRIESLLKDQAALHGLLNHLYNLGVTLLSVQRLAVPEENKRQI